MVIPCKNANGVDNGVIRIFRGAIQPDGSIVKIDTEILWEKTDLDEFYGLEQGDLLCSQTGACMITLTEKVNRMKAGEIFFLTFYKESFMTEAFFNKYYLFNDKLGDPQVDSMYDHLFFCRSFRLKSTNKMINGNVVKVEGQDLRVKNIYSKEQTGSIEAADFYTKSINLYLKIFNTDHSYCTSKDPVGTVSFEDIYDDHFMIENLDLRDCNEGDLFADVEITRGLLTQKGDFTHTRSEFIYNI